MIPYLWLEQAYNRLAGQIQSTPLTIDTQSDLYIKWENQQVTGSFKVRGALNKVFSLQPWELAQGLVTASAGNHGQGVALAGQKVGVSVIVFASQQAVPSKVSAMQDLGAEVRLVQGGYGDAENAGIEFSRQSGATWVSAYNDGQVIAGQGTIALEILEDRPSLVSATWVVPVGGGGLIAGVAAAVKSKGSSGQVIGVQSEASAFMHDIYYHGSQQNTIELPSLADGLSGPVEINSLTIPLIHNLVDAVVLVSEAEIASAIRYAWQQYHEIIEGSAAVALAAVLNGRLTRRPAVVIISGGNIQPEVHARILEG